jgi:hypothetical protein
MNIKPRQLLNALLIATPVLLLCLAIFRVVVAKANVVYPNPETESAFLMGYTLANAVVPGTPLTSGSSASASAGRGCASHQREFQFWFTIPSGTEPAVMAAVRRDLEFRLTRQGSQITAANGDLRKGFQFEYAAGHSKGSVIVDPLVIADSPSVAGQAGLRSGQLAVKLRIWISETWYKASEMSCGKL